MPFSITDRTGAFCMSVSSTSAVYPVEGTFPFRTASWVRSTRTLTKAGAFTNFVFESVGSDQIYIRSGGGFIPGFYALQSHTAGDNPVVLAPDPRLDRTSDTASDLAGFVVGNGSGYNAGATSATAADSIGAAAYETIIEEILITSIHTAATTITILAHDGSTALHAYAIAASASAIAYPVPLPLGTYGHRVRGGISAKTSNAGTTFELFGRVVLQ